MIDARVHGDEQQTHGDVLPRRGRRRRGRRQEYEHYREFGQAGRVVREYRQELMLFGNPDSVTRKIEWMRDELGVRYVICWMNMGGLEPDKVLRSMQLFATEVMPRFKTVEAAA